MALDDYVSYEPSVGEHISQVCTTAVRIAARRGKSVAFRFNDIEVLARPTEAASDVEARWEHDYRCKAEEWRQSALGLASAATAEESRRAAQAATEALLQEIPHRLGTLDDTVRWCVDLTRVSDHVGLDWSLEVVADALQLAGYEANAHVGTAPEVIKKSRRLMGEYIIGQVLDCLRKGMPPHPMTIVFAEQGGFVEKV